MQSALDPAGPQARAIATLGWTMMVSAAAIFLGVMLLTALALASPGRARIIGGYPLVIWGGIAFPIVSLSALLVYGLMLGGTLAGKVPDDALRIAVTGERWWWRIHYLGGEGEPLVASANEVRLPTGRPVEFVLNTADLIHSFWVPSLHGKLDMIPGRENRLVLQADRAGAYRGQCAEYCGAQHARMAFDVVALEPAEFERWLAREMQPVVPAEGELLSRGYEVFRASGCGACHAVRGTDAAGLIGPDLTHVGSRLSLAAGTLANNQGTLAAWVSHSQEIKPGNFMPSFEFIPPEDLRALAAWLESLK